MLDHDGYVSTLDSDLRAMIGVAFSLDRTTGEEDDMSAHFDAPTRIHFRVEWTAANMNGKWTMADWTDTRDSAEEIATTCRKLSNSDTQYRVREAKTLTIDEVIRNRLAASVSI